MAGAHPLINHNEIRTWAEARGGHPACVRGTGRKGGIGMIRLDFPGWSGEESLQEISWDQWFRQFDDNNLALLVQGRTTRGRLSNFNKLVARETAEGKQKSRRAGRTGQRAKAAGSARPARRLAAKPRSAAARSRTARSGGSASRGRRKTG